MARANRLAEQTSPYLRQHAANPVDWYPWGEEAFAAARERDVPILLSVGYSACHWCHVMAHESFEDPATAEVMNELFVNVKVDREERPDVDSIYMEAVQAVSGSGGWPMTVFVLPDGRPFFAGTYFPPNHFVDLLRRVAQAWGSQREAVVADASRLADAVRAGTALPGAGRLSGGDPEPVSGPQLLAQAADALLERYDPEWGGFARAPKFPQPSMLECLLQAATFTSFPRRADLLDAVTTTLDAMASGGIYDHLGGGFARYSTDRRWLVPHFEKMLYDNALLARVYLHAWQLTHEGRYHQVVTETLEYLLRQPMRQPGAGFSSAEDADSEGVEGRFYVWDLEEVVDVGGPDAAVWYGATADGNWEGRNILWRPVRGDLERPPAVEAGRRALFDRREGRLRPGLDDKVLTEWNAMAVAALAEAGAALERPDWVDAAEEVASFLLRELRCLDGRWLRSWQGSAAAGEDGSAGGRGEDSGAGASSGGRGGGQGVSGRAQHLAYASDHAWLIEAFTRLAEATGRSVWIAEARTAAEELLRRFSDPASGAFFTTGDDAEVLIARTTDTYDGALPSANAVAAGALARLGALTGERRYEARASGVINAMAPALAKAPMAFTGLVAAADLAARGFTEVVVTGERPDLVAAIRRCYRPDLVMAWGESYGSPLWEGRTGPETAGRAFVCRDYTCQAPVTDPEALRALLIG